MESKKMSRIKFSRLCLSQGRESTNTTTSTTTSATDRKTLTSTSTQISKFFNQSTTSSVGPQTVPITTKPQPKKTENSALSFESECSNENSENVTDLETQENASKTCQSERVTIRKSRFSDKTILTNTKSTIKTFFASEVNDSLSEFEIPKKVTKKMSRIKTVPTKKVKTTRIRKQPDIRKAINKRNMADECGGMTEGAQLELALALSKAATDGEGIDMDIDMQLDAPESTKQNLNLEAFEFRTANNYLSSDKNFTDFFVVNTKSTTRYKWKSKCTQLTRRKDHVQQSKIREQIDELLLNNILVESRRTIDCSNAGANDDFAYEISSKYLQRICIPERILFEINSDEGRVQDTLKCYYTNNLVQHSNLSAGVLLKDWSKIPGRDAIFDGIHHAAKAENEKCDSERRDEADIVEFTSEIISDVTSPENGFNESQHFGENANLNQPNDMVNTLCVLPSLTFPIETDNRHCEMLSKQSKETEKESDAEIIAENKTEEGSNIETNVKCDESSELGEDADKTIVLDSDDIQSKLNIINAKIRLSQKLSEVFDMDVVKCDSSTSKPSMSMQRPPSPDLFADDDDDDDDDDGISGCGSDFQPCSNLEDSPIKMGSPNYELKPRSSSDVVVISSCELEMAAKNSEEVDVLNADPGDINSVQACSTNEAHAENCDLIEISDSDSSQSTIENGDGLPNITDMIKSLDNILEFEQTKSEDDENGKKSESCERNANTSTSLNESLSFTERLQLYEIDILNGFNIDVMAKPKFELSHISRNSNAQSENEINYSMKFPSEKKRASDCRNQDTESRRIIIPNIDESSTSKKCDVIDKCDNDLDSPMAFDFLCDNHLSDDANDDNDEELVNQSVCNIFEKTFSHRHTPTSSVVKGRKSGGTALKKNNSEMTLKAESSFSGACNTPTNLKSPMKRYNHEEDHQFSRFNSPVKRQKTLSSCSMPNGCGDFSNDDFIIQFGSVSPKPDYERMDAAAIECELRKFGLKHSLRKRQAIICLEYIYNRTHPFIENDFQPVFKTSSGNGRYKAGSQTKSTYLTDQISEANKMDEEMRFNVGFSTHNLVDQKFKNVYVDKVFLPTCPRAKKPWCLQPLHIAWHNLIKANPKINADVRTHNPINLQELKKFFTSIDMSFNKRDLVSFLDVQCIAFRPS